MGQGNEYVVAFKYGFAFVGGAGLALALVKGTSSLLRKGAQAALFGIGSSRSNNVADLDILDDTDDKTTV